MMKGLHLAISALYPGLFQREDASLKGFLHLNHFTGHCVVCSPLHSPADPSINLWIVRTNSIERKVLDTVPATAVIR